VGGRRHGLRRALLALLLMLKSYQRMGCLPKLEDVPEMVVDFVRRAVELPEGTLPLYRASKTAKNHRGLVRQRVGVVYDQAEARRNSGCSGRAQDVDSTTTTEVRPHGNRRDTRWFEATPLLALVVYGLVSIPLKAIHAFWSA
jgi:hypothetical protein